MATIHDDYVAHIIRYGRPSSLLQRGETNAYYETGCVVEETSETDREASLEEVYVF